MTQNLIPDPPWSPTAGTTAKPDPEQKGKRYLPLEVAKLEDIVIDVDITRYSGRRGHVVAWLSDATHGEMFTGRGWRNTRAYVILRQRKLRLSLGGRDDEAKHDVELKRPILGRHQFRLEFGETPTGGATFLSIDGDAVAEVRWPPGAVWPEGPLTLWLGGDSGPDGGEELAEGFRFHGVYTGAVPDELPSGGGADPADVREILKLAKVDAKMAADQYRAAAFSAREAAKSMEFVRKKIADALAALKE